jgi:ribosomal protein S12 methylthiotransferase accessory factor
VNSPSTGTAVAKLDLGGTLRGREPSATLAWVRPFLPAFGITRLANVTGLDRIGIPVWMCIRPNGRALSVSQGKGVTSALAEVSAVMESIELYHAENAAPADTVASYRAVRRRSPAVNPRSLEPGIRWRAYHEAREIAWTRGTDLATGEATLVPHARIDMNWSEAHPDSGLFMVTSSGLASGNTKSEALCHAIFEVVERDADWRWEQSTERRQRATELNADSIDSPMLRGLLDQFSSAGVTARMWDITSAVGIPAFRCLIYDRGPLGRFPPFGGSGCHLSADIALSRALTEAAQSRLTFIAGSRDDMFFATYQPVQDASPDNARTRPTRRFQRSATGRLDATFEGDLQTTLQLLADAGFPRVVAVDHTRPEFGIPVVAVVIPGLHEAP